MRIEHAMTAFAQTFLLLRDPRAGVEDLAAMKTAGFAGVFCNLDFPAHEWEAVIRPRAQQQGMFCGPWWRTQAPDGTFSIPRLQQLVGQADTWQAPLIVNSEKELDGTGGTYTTEIAKAVGNRDAAISVEAHPFDSVEWWPLAPYPILPQLFPESGLTDIHAVATLWRSYGAVCVYATFATYGGRKPSDYVLQAPYSLYTADDMGGDYQAWTPTSSGYVGCTDTPDQGGDDMQTIGDQTGIDAMLSWLQKQPNAPQRGPGYDPDRIDTWPWPDKVHRTLTILAEDHDAEAKP